MPTTTIQVETTIAPKAGKKRGRIQAAGGQLFQADPSFIAMVKAGETYEVTYKDDEYNGTNFRVVEGIKESNVAPAAIAAHVAASAPGGKHYPQDLATAERIFVCGALNATLGNPSVSAATLTEDQITFMVKRLRAAWTRTFGGKPSTADEMDDEIPFS